ncbi:MAG: 23S rRNA (adenine(2503)-C(2))-methyltransferase RlmN, partial [Psittacicella sp.]
MSDKINLLGLTREKMISFVEEIGEKKFHADQLMKWVYHFHEDDFSKMTNLSKKLIAKLQEIAEIKVPTIAKEERSADGTIKWAFLIGDQHIESVYIPEKNRATLCISSQVGCALACKFCSTGDQGFNKNLSVDEIIGQVWEANKQAIKYNITPVTNVVFMGMGEPMLNLTNVIPAIHILLDDLGYGLSKRKVTVSTSGVIPGIKKLSESVDVALALSLHAPNNKLRSEIMPINDKFPLEPLIESINNYLKVAKGNHGKATIEYVMLSGVNDSEENAHELAKLLKNTPNKVNLIPWNPYPGAIYETSSRNKTMNFQRVLSSYGMTVTIRKTR